MEVRLLVRRPVLVHDTAKLMPELAYAYLESHLCGAAPHTPSHVVIPQHATHTTHTTHLRQGVSG